MADECVDVTVPAPVTVQVQTSQGTPGPPGPGNELTIGTVTEGSPADASITGTSPNQILNLTLPPGPKGDPGNPSDYLIVGGGRPDSSTSTLVGALYTDQNQTTGAELWRLDITSTWRVVRGNTGWRSVPGPTVAAGTVLMRRINDMVEVVFDGVDFSDTGGHPLLCVVTNGFRYRSTSSSWQYAGAGWSTGGSPVNALLFAGTGELHCAVAANATGIEGRLQWSTEDAWPTTLPGSPA